MYCRLRSSYQEGRLRIPLTPPHLLYLSKTRNWIPISYVVVFFVLWWNCWPSLNFLFIIIDFFNMSGVLALQTKGYKNPRFIMTYTRWWSCRFWLFYYTLLFTKPKQHVIEIIYGRGKFVADFNMGSLCKFVGDFNMGTL